MAIITPNYINDLGQTFKNVRCRVDSPFTESETITKLQNLGQFYQVVNSKQFYSCSLPFLPRKITVIVEFNQDITITYPFPFTTFNFDSFAKFNFIGEHIADDYLKVIFLK